MRVKRCVYAKCNSDSRYMHKDHMKDVTFTPFPKPKTDYPRCIKWLERIGRPDFSVNRVNCNTYVCSKHFVGAKGPTLKFPHPLHNDKVTVNPVNISTIKLKGFILPLSKVIFKPLNEVNEPTSKSPVTTLKETQDEIENIEIMVDPTIFEIHENDKSKIEERSVELKSLVKTTNKVSAYNTDIKSSHLELQCKDLATNNSSVNLRDTFKDYSPSANWSFSFTKSSFKIRKLNEESGSLIFSASIDETFEAHYEALGKKVSNVFVLSKLPKVIGDLKTLLTLIDNIDKWKLCCGNVEEKYITAFKNGSNINGFINSISGAIHNKNCSLFVLDPKRTRCFFCLKQRACLQHILTRNKKKTTSKIQHFKNLSKKELIISLRKAKREIVLLSAKVERLKRRVT